ncbi:MAG: hypothetical protein WCI36_02760 [bacterium]
MAYVDSHGESVDFEKKRFKFWLENVPKKIRRMEYELSVLYRRLLNANLYKFDNKEKHGRFLVLPAFNEEAEKLMWDQFVGSFLRGKDRIIAFDSIANKVRENISVIMSEADMSIVDEKIKIIAIGGSSFYGPRKLGERLSDIDIHILLDDDTDFSNFEIFPKTKESEIINPYHIIGTGKTDQSRGKNRQIHWLLYPHFPVLNKMNSDELSSVIADLSNSTIKREGEIINTIDKMRKRLDELRLLDIRENHSY